MDLEQEVVGVGSAGDHHHPHQEEDGSAEVLLPLGVALSVSHHQLILNNNGDHLEQEPILLVVEQGPTP